jgi:hypothetical protein
VRAEIPVGSTPGDGYGKSVSAGGESAGPSGAFSSVSRILAFAGIIVSGLVAVLFIADLAAGFPFQRVSVLADAGFIVASLLCGYLSWSILPRPPAA